MPGKKYAVVFDTNSYRQLVRGKNTNDNISFIKKILDAEEKKNIISFGSVIVALEMLSNLVEGEEGLNYEDCLNGLITMGYHCENVKIQKIRIFPHVNLLIAKSLFNLDSKDIEKLVLNIASVIYDFKDDSVKAIAHHKNRTLNEVKEYIDNEEISFSDSIINLIDGLKEDILSKHPNIRKKELRDKLLLYIKDGSFESKFAVAIIRMIASKFDFELTETECLNRALFLKEVFPLSTGFYKSICYKIVFENLDMKSKKSKEKRWNWLWDYNISFIISNSTMDNRETFLVTSDKDVISILEQIGYRNRVKTIKEYLQFLDL